MKRETEQGVRQARVAAQEMGEIGHNGMVEPEDFFYVEREPTYKDLEEIEQEIVADKLFFVSTEGNYSDDPVEQYLQEIGREPLLSPQEEPGLFKRIDRKRFVSCLKGYMSGEIEAKNGILPFVGSGSVARGVLEDIGILPNIRFIKEEAKEGKTLSGKEKKKPLDKTVVGLVIADKERLASSLKNPKVDEYIKDGITAERIATEKNLRLVVSVARTYTYRIKGSANLSLLDLFQIGNIGLIKAVREKFQWQKGYKFSTYAIWWIRQAIGREIIYQGGTIRMPVHINEHMTKLNKAARALREKNGRRPTDKELSGQPGITKNFVVIVRRAERVANVASLDAPYGPTEDGNGNPLGDFVEDKKSPPVEDSAANNLLKDEVRDILALPLFTEKEKKILQLRFGLEDEVERTLEEVGRIFGVTRERIRQIEAKALGKLRRLKEANYLKDYLD